LSVRDALVFGAPAVIAVELAIVGRLFATELILLASLPVLLRERGRMPIDRTAQIVGACGALWLGNQVVTDIVRDSVFHDYARGWLKIFFAMSNSFALYLLLANERRRYVLFVLGAVVGLLVQYVASPDFLARIDPWKFGLAFPLTMLIALVASHHAVRRLPLLPPGLLAGAAALNLEEGYRSLAGVCFLAAGYIGVQQFVTRDRERQVHLSLAQVLAVCVMTVALGFAFLATYAYAAQHGLLGSAAARKYAEQKSNKFGSVVIDGRPTIYIASKAIADAPVVGHGSWASDPRYAREGLTDLERAGYRVDPNIQYELLHETEIPTHSYLFGAWVEAGVFGALFWLVVLGLIGWVFLNLFGSRVPLSPLIALYMMLLTWNILFSPFGAEHRVFAPFGIVLMLFARRSIKAQTAVPKTRGRRAAGQVT
jgi:hypothetical protein